MSAPSDTVQAAQPAFPHYFKALPPGCTHVDVYRVLDLFGVTDAPIQHAVKKLLCAGQRGAKDQAQDVAEAIATLQRWQQMRAEEQGAALAVPTVDLSALKTDPELLDKLMGANEAHAIPPGNAEEKALRQGMRAVADDFFKQFATSNFQPAESGPVSEHPPHDPIAEGFRRKAERAKYLARWANAPAEATHLAQELDGMCHWFSSCPWQGTSGYWHGEPLAVAEPNLLGRVACEPRPEVRP
jgi:hypothetical protein